MAENPPVRSKFDRAHGKPRKPGRVTTPGQPAHGGWNEDVGAVNDRETRAPVSHTPDHHEEAQHKTLQHGPNEHGAMERGERAGHPAYRGK